jgi:hypothetical protein
VAPGKDFKKSVATKPDAWQGDDYRTFVDMLPDGPMQSNKPHTQKEKTNVTALVVHDETNAALSVDERTEFQQLETVIHAGLQTFFEVGNALMEIRDRRLYRETHKTFEDYCNERWQFSGRRANQLIGAAQVTSDLGTIVPIPENEAQARPLTQLAPERRVEVWQRAVATAPDGQVTAKHVQQVVNEALGKAGRFENKKFYAVNNRDNVVYRQVFDKALYGSESGAFFGCIFHMGERLNQEKQYDAYMLVDVPLYSPSDVIPLEPTKNQQNWQYPVSEKDKTIYDDPRDYGRKPGYYEHCEWYSLREIQLRWSSLFYRYGDFKIAPALQVSTAWLAKALFQPGMYAQCPECSKRTWVLHNGIYPFEEWTVDGDGIWACEDGHRISDTKMVIVDQATFTAAVANDDEELDDEDDEPEEESPVTEDMERFLNLVGWLPRVLQAIRELPELLAADAMTPEIVAYYNKEFNYYKRPVTDEAITAARHLKAWLDLLDEDESTDDGDETEE